MADIELSWPLDLRPGEQSFYIRTLSTRFENPLTGQVQVLERDAARWVTKLSLVRAELDSRRLDAFLAALRGSVGHAFIPDFRRLKAKGSLAGTPQLVSGTGTTLTVDNFTPDAVGVLKGGDPILGLQNLNHYSDPALSGLTFHSGVDLKEVLPIKGSQKMEQPDRPMRCNIFLKPLMAWEDMASPKPTAL